MEKHERISGPVNPIFVHRLKSMGATAVGTESVFKSILGNSRVASIFRAETLKKKKCLPPVQPAKPSKLTLLGMLSLGAFVLSGFTVISGFAQADTLSNSIKLLTARFPSRQVTQVEIGDFHFKPGQIAPIHKHVAPAVGYVVQGTIIYQIAGGQPQILQAGDVFYEPPGPRILRFDNASATQEAIFLDFNLQQKGEPFIVFEKPPVEAIDRRAQQTVGLDNKRVEQVEFISTDLPRGGKHNLVYNQPMVGLVASGVVELRVSGDPVQRIAAGKSFALPKAGTRATLVNASSEVPAKVITFVLK